VAWPVEAVFEEEAALDLLLSRGRRPPEV